MAIVEFTDFHCPFCKKVQSTLARVRSRYGEKVKFVHRDPPIDQLHPNARKAHEAARCANEQGKFWTYHAALYANAPKAGPADLQAYAREGGLDVSAFVQCVTSGKYQAAVQQDVDEGRRLGVTGTPAFLINGRMLTGAQSLETVAGDRRRPHRPSDARSGIGAWRQAPTPFTLERRDRCRRAGL